MEVDEIEDFEDNEVRTSDEERNIVKVTLIDQTKAKIDSATVLKSETKVE